MSFVPCEQIWSILDSHLRHLLLMMIDCPLEICHKKGEYICKGDFVVRRRFLMFWSCGAFRLYLGASFCIYIFGSCCIFFFLIGLSMIRGDTMMYLYLFLVSQCATLIIDLYL